ncbi:MAG: NAD(P)H-flavin oxidoreductase [Burkholderia sp.]|jgi:flavin reductase (DIM6/NTAB) family NADH-FMN oxidoreductase RutF
MTNPHIVPVELDKVYRILNIGATTLVSAKYGEETDTMAAAWVCALNIDPARLTAIIDSTHFTRPLIEKSGYFAVQIPTARIADQVMALGSISKNDDPKKLEKSGAKFFTLGGYDIPLTEGCAAWIICKVVPEPHNEKAYDLFIGEPVAAWADDRIFNGHWLFETAPDEMKTLHYVAGAHFYKIGEALDVKGY